MALGKRAGACVIGDLTPLALGLAASVATSLGGMLALRFRARLSLILALAAGIVLGVAFFELIPEALHLATTRGEGASLVLATVAGGFLALMTIDRGLRASPQARHLRAHLSPASLTLHSIVDGAGIALAYRLAPEIGWSVAIAVLSHDLADGANVVGATLPAGERRSTWLWLAVNGLAPLAGVGLTYLFEVPLWLLTALVAALAGAFLYIGGSELLPRSYRMDRRIGTPVTSVLGFALVYLGTRFA